jgi:hypothetical protein
VRRLECLRDERAGLDEATASAIRASQRLDQGPGARQRGHARQACAEQLDQLPAEQRQVGRREPDPCAVDGDRVVHGSTDRGEPIRLGVRVAVPLDQGLLGGRPGGLGRQEQPIDVEHGRAEAARQDERGTWAHGDDPGSDRIDVADRSGRAAQDIGHAESGAPGRGIGDHSPVDAALRRDTSLARGPARTAAPR